MGNEKLKTTQEKIVLKAILVGAELNNLKGKFWNLEESLKELKELARTADIEVEHIITQKLSSPNSRTYVGKGKVQEIKNILSFNPEINLVIFDNSLTPGQGRNLERELETDILDRVELILHIFSLHAQTQEGRMQVDLAKYQYELPRLKRMWTHLQRQTGGGVTSRGQGEKQIENDKRILRDRISNLKNRISEVQKIRETQRKSRQDNEIPVVAICGYTNVGKSSLLNHISDANVLAENKLFATLDPTTKKVQVSSNKTILFSDTVGFIRNIPHELVVSFRATFEEIKKADLILHLVDGSHDKFEEQYDSALTVLEEMKAIDIPRIDVFNKSDNMDIFRKNRVVKSFPEALVVSVAENSNIDTLLNKIDVLTDSDYENLKLRIPMSDTKIISKLYNEFNVNDTEYDEESNLLMNLKIKKKYLHKIPKDYII